MKSHQITKNHFESLRAFFNYPPHEGTLIMASRRQHLKWSLISLLGVLEEEISELCSAILKQREKNIAGVKKISLAFR